MRIPASPLARARLAAAAAALVALATVVPLILHGGVPDFCDPITQAFPYHAYLAREVKLLRLPLLNPYQMGGTSFVGNVQASILYPPRLACALLPEGWGFGLLLGLHLSLAAWGAALLASRLGAMPLASFVAGVCFALGGFMIRKLALPPILLTGAWLPLVILCVEDIVRGRGSAVLLSLVVAMTLVAGHPQTSLLVLLMAAGLAALRLSPAILTLRRSSRLTSAVTAVALIWVGGFFTVASFGQPWLHPLRVFPWLLLLGGFAAWELGCRRLCVAVRAMPLRAPLQLLLGGSLGVLLAMGQILPVMEHVRASHIAHRPDRPERFAAIEDRPDLWMDATFGTGEDAETSLYVGPLGLILALLALFHGRTSGREGVRPLVLLALLLFFVACGPMSVRHIFLRMPLLSQFPVLFRYLLGPALVLALLAGLGADLLMARLRPHALRLILVAVVLVPLVVKARPFAAGREPSDLYPPSFAEGTLRSVQGLWRFFSLDRDPPLLSYDYRRPELAALLFPNLGMVAGFEDLQGYDPVQGIPLWIYLKSLGPERWWPDPHHFAAVNRVEPSLLSLLGVRYALVHREADRRLPGYVVRAWGKEGILYELPTALPRAFVPERVECERDVKTTLARIAGAPDPSRVAYVAEPLRIGPQRAAPIRVARPRPGHLLVDGDVGGLLVVTELYSSAWRARVDGHAVPVIPADGVLLGVPCPRVRRIELEYRPAGYQMGLFSSLCGVLAVGVSGGLAMRPRGSGGRA